MKKVKHEKIKYEYTIGKKCNMRRVKNEEGATLEECNTEKVQHEKSATQKHEKSATLKKCNMKRMQHEKSVYWK